MLACKSNVFFNGHIVYYLAQYNSSNVNEDTNEVRDCFICFVPYSKVIEEFGHFDGDDYTHKEIEEDITVMCEVDYNPLAKNPTCYIFSANVCEEYYDYPDTSKGTDFEDYFEVDDNRVFSTENFVAN